MAQMDLVCALIVCVAVTSNCRGRIDREPDYDASKKLLMSQRVLLGGSLLWRWNVGRQNPFIIMSSSTWSGERIKEALGFETKTLEVSSVEARRGREPEPRKTIDDFAAIRKDLAFLSLEGKVVKLLSNSRIPLFSRTRHSRSRSSICRLTDYHGGMAPQC